MSCSHGKQSGECVCDVVRKIVAAQNEVAAQAQGDCCNTGCHRAIEQLLSPATAPIVDGPTTIPFLLYCKGDCDLFFATGVSQSNGDFECIESAVFKAKQFKKGCCVELELLEFETDSVGSTVLSNHDACDFIPNNTTGNFVESGICITVDLHHFIAIQCLAPTTPIAQVSPIANNNHKHY
ncbi:CotY/CotZ family spore coat protein [Ornithinibacillus contaminans]|uniref:CotY/CotZ family spore coat protein n=1 Tax=Ornithinibacillus contaminans TaxID=694055 RepID=UPI00069D89F2|nr:CotY/CotZ family spore coat protein [Ornithinibacillus contaminans]